MNDEPSQVPLRERTGTALDDRQKEIRRHIQDLYSDDYAVRAGSVSELEKFGKPAAEAIVDTLLKASPEVNSLLGFSDALEEIGQPSVQVLIHALTHVGDVRTPEEVRVIQSFIETLSRLADGRAAEEPMTHQLGAFNRAIRRNHNKPLVEACEAAKIRIQALLGDMGSRAGLEDLMTTLAEGRRRMPDGIVDAVARVGDRRALIPLLRLHAIEENVSFAGAEAIRGAFREIVRRERLGTDDPIFGDLAPEERATLERLWPKPRTGRISQP